MKKINMQKRKLATLALSSMLMLWVSIAWNVGTTNLSSQYTQCNGNESIDENYYIVWQNYTRDNTRDTFWNSSVTSFISAAGSEVQLWRNNWVLSNCSDWGRISNVAEKSSTDRVLAILNFDGCTLNKPSYSKASNPTRLDAQLHFVIWYYEKKIWPAWTTMTSKFWFKDFDDAYWTCYPNHEQTWDISQCEDTEIRYSTSLKQHKRECINYRVFWCWDWLVNSPYGTGYTNWNFTEQCDPNDPNHAWWETWTNKTCNQSCQLVNNQTQQPQCHSQYNWKTTYTANWNSLLNSTSNYLCSVWTASNFTWTWTFWTWRHFTWQCTVPWQTPVNCSANQIWCWDGQINSGSEICEKSSLDNRGWCDTSCNLVTPTCIYNLSATPNNVTAPRTITIDGSLINPWNTPWWYYLTNLYFWDWSSTGNGRQNMSLPQTHYYANAWTFTITWVIRNYHTPVASGVHSSDRPVAYCTTTVTLTAQPQAPACSSQYNNHTQYTTWTSANWLTQNMPLCTNWTVTWFSYSWQTWHSRHFYRWCTNWTQTVTWCIAYQNWCGNRRIETGNNEFCDDWLLNGTPWYCNLSCTGIVPTPWTWSLSIVKEQISTWTMEAGSLVVYKIIARNTWSAAVTGVTIYDVLPKELQYMASSISIVPSSTYHFKTWTVNIWGYSRAYILYTGITLNANWTATVYLTWKVKNWVTFDTLTNCASVSWTNIPQQEDCVTVTPPTPWTPVPYFLKEQKTWTVHGTFTTSDMVVNIWNIIRYKLNFGNLGEVAATWKVRDKLPQCIQYLTSSIVGVSQYTFQKQLIWWQWLIMYKDMPLAAWETWYVLIKASILSDWACANVTSYLNTWYFTLWWTTLSGDVLAVRPKPYVKKWQRLYDTDQWVRELLHVSLWQTIQYKVDFRNDWSAWATGEVKDVLPNCVKYLTSSLHLRPGSWPTTGYEWLNEYVKYSDIYLAPGQSGYMLVLWLIQSEGDCQSVTWYLNTWMFHFIGDPWMTSIVVAEREPSTTVEIVKEVTPTTVRSWDIVTYTITYTNHGPETLNSYTIVDNWPSTKIRFLTWSSERPRDSFVNWWNTLTWYYNNQNFASGSTRTIIVTWQVLSL